MKLSEAIEQYTSLKKSMGMRFNAETVILKAFCKTLEDPPLAEVQADHVINYLYGKGPITRFWHRKQEALRGFYRFAITRSYVKKSPVPKWRPKPTQSFTPYIYSQEELQRLVNAASSYQNKRSKVQGVVLRMLLLLLYGAALRISEALSLTLADVNLKEELLIIRESKFYKTRRIPIALPLVAALSDYMEVHRKQSYSLDEQTKLIVTNDGSKFTVQLAERAFCRIRELAEVSREDHSRYQPRLHDLRHSFAVHRLESWYHQGKDVQQLLPKLATYLGHVHLGATQHYLTMTAELLHQANKRFERYALGRRSQS